MAVDEGVVSEDVYGVGTENHPHRSGGVGGAVGGLLAAIEDGHWQEGGQDDEIVAADEREELLGLSEAVKEEVERAHDSGEAERHEDVDLQSGAEGDADLVVLLAAVECADERCHAGGEAYLHDGRYHEEGVDEGGCRKFVSAVGSDHHCIGEVDHDDADLCDEYGEAEPPQVFVFGLVCFPETRPAGE